MALANALSLRQSRGNMCRLFDEHSTEIVCKDFDEMY